MLKAPYVVFMRFVVFVPPPSGLCIPFDVIGPKSYRFIVPRVLLDVIGQEPYRNTVF